MTGWDEITWSPVNRVHAQSHLMRRELQETIPQRHNFEYQIMQRYELLVRTTGKNMQVRIRDNMYL